MARRASRSGGRGLRIDKLTLKSDGACKAGYQTLAGRLLVFCFGAGEDSGLAWRHVAGRRGLCVDFVTFVETLAQRAWSRYKDGAG